jgi:hypothetical protein
MQITKIAHKTKPQGNDVIAHVTIEYSDGPRETVLHTTGERAAPEFYKAFDDLAPIVCDISEFSTNEVERTAVSGLSIAHHEDKETGESNMAVIFTARRKLVVSPQPIFYNTPAKWERHNDVNQSLTEPALKLVNDLLGEAKAYIEGKREQVAMDLAK